MLGREDLKHLFRYDKTAESIGVLRFVLPHTEIFRNINISVELEELVSNAPNMLLSSR